MANDNNKEKTVAVVTVFYKGHYLTSLVFDTPQTGDAIITTLQSAFNDRGKSDIVFKNEIRTLYDTQTIQSELHAFADNFIKPQGTLLAFMQFIDKTLN